MEVITFIPVGTEARGLSLAGVLLGVLFVGVLYDEEEEDPE
jgi:hypothetical protein